MSLGILLSTVRRRIVDVSGAFSPTDIAGLVCWVRSDLGVTKTISDLVSDWADQSGNGNNFTATGNARPTWVDTVLNSEPVIRFNGGTNVLTGANFSSLTEAEVFLVVRADADPAAIGSKSGLWHLGNDATPFSTHYPFTDGNVYESFGSKLRKATGNPALSLASFRNYNCISTSAEWTSNIDGTQHFTTATNTVSFAASSSLGKSVNVHYFDGDIAELILFDNKISTSDRAAIETYISSRYGI